MEERILTNHPSSDRPSDLAIPNSIVLTFVLLSSLLKTDSEVYLNLLSRQNMQLILISIKNLNGWYPELVFLSVVFSNSSVLENFLFRTPFKTNLEGGMLKVY